MNQETSLPSATAGRALRIPIVAAAIVLGAGAIVLARHYERPDPPSEPKAPGMYVGSDSVKLDTDAPAWSVIKLGTPQPAQPRWTDPIPARVVFDERRASRMGSPLAGRVTAVLAERGQRVKTGDPLFVVSSANLAELRNDVAKATLEQATAKINLDRVQALVDAGSTAGKELVAAKQVVAEADLALRLAQQKLTSLKVSGNGDTTFTVTAPRDGVVVEKNLAIGQLVDPSNGSLMAIADLGMVWVVADLFEADVGGLTPGTKAKVIVNGTTELEATVAQVSQVVDPDRHTVPVKVELANPDGALRPNSYAQLELFDATPAKVTLPPSAVMSDGSKSYVYLKDSKGALVRRDIKAGSVSTGVIPVLDGLDATDQVVVQGAILLDNQIQLDN
jgi:RND family efflux transporter MFP subunit